MRESTLFRRCLRLLERLAIVLAIRALSLEGFFRYVLFGDDPLARRLGAVLREDFRRSGRKSKDYYFQRGVRGQNHYTPLGNEVVFRELYTWLSESSR